MPQPSQALETQRQIGQVYDLIVSHYGVYAAPQARLARDAGVTTRTAHNWLNRHNAPSLRQFLSIMQHNGDFRKAVVDMVSKMDHR